MDVAAILKQKPNGERVETAAPDTAVMEIARRLSARRIGAIVIVDAAQRVAGIISERDIIRWVAAEGSTGLDARASDVMTHKVVTCTREETLDQLMERMTTRRFRHLPVVEEGRLIGIVSIGDVVKRHIEEVVQEADAMRQYIGAA